MECWSGYALSLKDDNGADLIFNSTSLVFLWNSVCLSVIVYRRFDFFPFLHHSLIAHRFDLKARAAVKRGIQTTYVLFIDMCILYRFQISHRLSSTQAIGQCILLHLSNPWRALLSIWNLHSSTFDSSVFPRESWI